MKFFDKFIFPNLRKSIRNLGNFSNWYFVLKSLAMIFDSKLQIIEEVNNSIFLNSSTGSSLNDWGKRYNILRIENESDDAYKNRILFKRSITTSGLSRFQKARILESLLSLPSFSIRIENGSERVGFRIGDAIGTGIVSRAYSIFSYTVFIDLGLTVEQRKVLTDYIHLVNIGGNFPFFSELQEEFNIFKMAGEIGSVLISKNQVTNKIYINY